MNKTNLEKKEKFIIITGCEGFIGSNIAKKINNLKQNYKIIGCGSLNKKEKLENINNVKIIDYWNKNKFFENLKSIKSSQIKAIIHMGACSSTNEWNGEYLMENNTAYTNKLIDYSIKNNIRLIHASSASVYGIKGEASKTSISDCIPLNMYAYSKLISDNYLINNYPKQRNITALRFFNVFGINEKHKLGMASPVHTFNHQAREFGAIGLFKEFEESSIFQRDFISVNDIANLIIELIDKKNCFGIFDAGTSSPSSFFLIANLIKNWWQLKGKNININEIDFPDQLLGHYQTYTRANMSYINIKKFKWRPSKIEMQISNFLEEFNSDFVIKL